MRQRNALATGWPVWLAIATLALGAGGVPPVSAQPGLVNPLGQQTSFVEPGNLDASVLFDVAFETTARPGSRLRMDCTAMTATSGVCLTPVTAFPVAMSARC